MKKLMMMLAAGLTATAIMAVTSANIVGYMAVDTPDSGESQMYTPMFVTVGGAGTSILLGDIVPNANFSGDNGDSISFMNAAGSWTVTASYYGAEYGWLDPFDGTDYNEVVLNPSTTFMATTLGSGGTLTFPSPL